MSDPLANIRNPQFWDEMQLAALRRLYATTREKLHRERIAEKIRATEARIQEKQNDAR